MAMADVLSESDFGLKLLIAFTAIKFVIIWWGGVDYFQLSLTTQSKVDRHSLWRILADRAL